ncbi:MAG: Spy/CpxP family protein refolding chaperone [Acidobacteriota bacterium]|nr:Spy/CpxP family protein refolding chaperone [Acidobacteriota bacterium]
MTKRVLHVFAAAALSVSFLCAQTSGTRDTTRTPPAAAQIVANRVSRLTTLLDLTAAQQSQATAIFTTQQTAVAATRTAMQTAQTALQTAVQGNSASGIAAAATTLGNLTTQQIEAQANADLAFFAILTADQQTKYKELQAGGFGGLGGPGFGGPGGGPRGPRP